MVFTTQGNLVYIEADGQMEERYEVGQRYVFLIRCLDWIDINDIEW
jgi:hypothetical protein